MARIKIDNVGYWDSSKEAQEQSAAAKQWLDEVRRTNADSVVKDANGRIFKWIYSRDGVVLTIEHKYLYPNSTNWTVDKISINVTKQ